MNDGVKPILEQLDACIDEFNRASNASPHDDLSGGLDKVELHAMVARCDAALQRLTPPGSAYRERARAIPETGNVGVKLIAYAGIVRALRADYGAGYMRSVTELIHAEVFADFVEMADELHRSGYKDAAAVIAGSTLEEHLRKLAVAAGVAVEKQDGTAKKADTLNADLKKANVYTGLEQKSVTAWLDLRNKAAHGRYDEYDAGQVAGLIRDIRGFMIRHAA